MMNKLLVPFMFIVFIFCCICCIRHSTNPVVDSAIHITESAYPSDNAIEEEAEEIIEDTTGLDVDLSPSSPEVEKLADQEKAL